MSGDESCSDLYPHIGIYFADCPSAGHDMLCLDYRECGPTGEPKVIHIDQELDYRITVVAESFEAFIRGLERRAHSTPRTHKVDGRRLRRLRERG